MTNKRGTQFVSLPVQFHIGSARLKWQIVHQEGCTLFAGSCFSSVAMEDIQFEDGWDLVRRYLGVNAQDEQSVLDFLGAHGRFSAPSGSIKTALLKSTQLPIRSVWHGEHDKGFGIPTEMVMESFSIEEFAVIQGYVRRMLISGNPTLGGPWKAESIQSIQRYEIAFAGARSGPQAHVIVSSTFPSILATVQFKLAQGARFKTCYRKDCHLPFEVTSRHPRRFCTQYCAHITSLRQRRKILRKTKKEESAR